jgi:TonB family protein
VPDDKTKEAIQKAGKDKIVASYKLCLSSNGSVTTVTQLKSSGFPDYDAKIKAGIKTWRYRPYVINGAPAPVCTAVTFIYAQK